MSSAIGTSKASTEILRVLGNLASPSQRTYYNLVENQMIREPNSFCYNIHSLTKSVSASLPN